MNQPHWTTKIPLNALREHENCKSVILKEQNLIFATRKQGETISIYTIAGGIIDPNEIWELAKRTDLDFILCLKKDSLISGGVMDHLAEKKISIGTMKDMMRIVGNYQNWPYTPPDVNFIMQSLSQHKKVDNVKRVDNRKYLVRRKEMKDVIMIPTQDYDVTAQSVREAYALANNDAQVIVAANPNRRITNEAYSIAEHLEVDLCTWSEFLGKLNSKMELDAILDECLKFLKSKIIIFPEIRLYLFGSASTRSNKYNDIDILVIYQKSETLDAFIQEIKHFKFYPIIHLTCLTTNEDKELKFSSLQDAIGLP